MPATKLRKQLQKANGDDIAGGGRDRPGSTASIVAIATQVVGTILPEAKPKQYPLGLGGGSAIVGSASNR